MVIRLISRKRFDISISIYKLHCRTKHQCAYFFCSHSRQVIKATKALTFCISHRQALTDSHYNTLVLYFVVHVFYADFKIILYVHYYFLILFIISSFSLLRMQSNLDANKSYSFLTVLWYSVAWECNPSVYVYTGFCFHN